MKHLKLFEEFVEGNKKMRSELKESVSSVSMWQNGDNMISDCKDFLISNLPFKYADVFHPKDGYGATVGDFTMAGIVNLQVSLKDKVYYTFSSYIKSSGLFDMEYKSRRAEYIDNGGSNIKFVFYSGSNALNRGSIIMIASGTNYEIGNYENANGFSNKMKSIWNCIKESNNDEQFKQLMEDLNMPTIGDRTLSKWHKEWYTQHKKRHNDR